MKALLPLYSLLALSFAAVGANPGGSKAPQLSAFKVGRSITGPAVDLSKAKGKAVFIDAWGIHCGPCLALMPEVEKLSHRYKDKLIVIGAHSQEGTDAEIKAVVKEKRVTYAIVDGVTSPVNFEMLPFGFVFDANGTLLFAGRPDDQEFEKAIHKAVQTVSADTSKPSGLDALKR